MTITLTVGWWMLPPAFWLILGVVGVLFATDEGDYKAAAMLFFVAATCVATRFLT